MTMDKLFDGSDAHLLHGNAALIERLRHNPAIELFAEAADALEAADKRIAEERAAYDRLLEEGANKLHEAERKLDVAREALYGWIDYNFHHHCWPDNFNKTQAALNLIGREALAQIGGDDEQT